MATITSQGCSQERIGARLADQEDFRVFVAADRGLRQRAYRLAQRIYRGRGFCDSDDWQITPFDLDPETLTLLAVDEQGRDIATISLIYDSPAGLPCDEIYRHEVGHLRSQGRKLVEVTRLVVDPDIKTSHLLLPRLINMVCIHAGRIKGCDDFVIEVNPRHASWYERKLRFEMVGPERACPRVRGAPAVLLRLRVDLMEREVRRLAGRPADRGERTIYPFFFSGADEAAATEYLARSAKPMSGEDARFFGLPKYAGSIH